MRASLGRTELLASQAIAITHFVLDRELGPSDVSKPPFDPHDEYADRQRPCCVWLTGLAGSGKSSIANKKVLGYRNGSARAGSGSSENSHSLGNETGFLDAIESGLR